MVRLLLLGALCVLFLASAGAQNEGSDAEMILFTDGKVACTWNNLGYNPWVRWNAFASANIGDYANPVSYFFNGRTASGASSYFRPIVAMAVGPSIHITNANDNSTKWSATAGGEFFLSGGGTGNGGVEAVGKVTLESTTIHGDVNSEEGPANIGPNTAVLGNVRAPSVDLRANSQIYGSNIQATPALSVDLSKVTHYINAISTHYFNMPANYVSFTYHAGATPSTIVLAPGLNVLQLTMSQINAMSSLVISGGAHGILVINSGGNIPSITIPKICFDSACSVQPSKGKVLINFYNAKAFEISVTSNAYTSVLAPKAIVSIHSGGLYGNLMVRKLGAQSVQGQVVNIFNTPWSDNAQCTEAALTDDVSGEPEPGQCGGACAWTQSLGFNPWQQWNLFSFGNIGTQDLPFGAIIQGRVAAVGNAWFNAVTLHSVESGDQTADKEASAEQDDGEDWSVTVGENFTFLGGSVKNGGVEAGLNLLVQAADVAGDVTAVHGIATIGTTNNAATIAGKARASVKVVFSQGSSADDGVHVTPNGLSLSVDLNGVGDFFKKQSQDYANEVSAPNSVDFAPSADTPNDIIVELHAGLNVVSLTPRAFLAAQRLQLNGDAKGVLVINVGGTTADLDALDVYEGDWATIPTKGRVLVNFYEATQLTVEWGSGSFSILAPLADVVYKSGVFAGNWVVGSLKSQWAGGTEIDNLPWAAPCDAAVEC